MNLKPPGALNLPNRRFDYARIRKAAGGADRTGPRGAAHSSNADGSDPSAGEKVDLVWKEHVNQALAVLHTMREPDERMAAVGDADAWSRMVEEAIETAE